MKCNTCPNPSKIMVDNKAQCWHCYLKDDFDRRFPQGIIDEKSLKGRDVYSYCQESTVSGEEPVKRPRMRQDGSCLVPIGSVVR